MAVTTNETEKKSPSLWGDVLFWGSVGVTAIWCSLLGLLAYYRVDDYTPLLGPSSPEKGASHLSRIGETIARVVAFFSLDEERLDGRLTLNEIGDTLAGAFAPLAFLWFFVSTYLQRTELKETRAVLIDQQAEMKRQAKESAEQTGIMQRQLETARSREDYEEHRLRLFYLALYLVNTASTLSLDLKDGQSRQTLSLYLPFYSENSDFKPIRLEDNQPSVDKAIQHLKRTLPPLLNLPEEPDDLGGEARVKQFVAAIIYIESELQDLVHGSRYAGNPLIAARVKGIQLDTLYFDVAAASVNVRDLASSIGQYS